MPKGTVPNKKKRKPGNSKADEVARNKKNTKRKPSTTVSSGSNTNLVKGGSKGAWGAMGIKLPTGGAGKGKKKKNPSATSSTRPQNEVPKGKPGTKTKTQKPSTTKTKSRNNPGNRKPVGNAGEKEDKGMFPGGGVRGKGDNKTKTKGRKNKK